MTLSGRWLSLLLCASACGLTAATADLPSVAPLRIEEFRGEATAVRAWDGTSPQRLVRIGGELFQQDDAAGLYFKVARDRISVRLADATRDWNELVSRATDMAPDSFEILGQLTTLRTNRLGIVDLAVPEGTDPVDWCELVHKTGLARYAEVVNHGRYDAAPNDPQYPDQWARNNTGQTGGTPGADINVEPAWDLTAGDPSIVVAVLDSGTDVDHEDLAANVWHNDGEIPNNGVDDDGNGFVDDWEGWNFDLNTNDPRSNNYHGTFVTGVVNAVGDNGIGIAGVAGGLGGPGVSGMALNIGQNAPNAAVIDDAILYAADNGARVITISLAIGETQAINDALAYAYNVKDVFIDCASGNSGPSVAYPATRPEAMAVGSTTHNDQASGFSNPGPEVEVAAPGSSVLSTRLNDTYGTDSGTSFAAPAVAGLAGLIRSRNPGLTAADVRQLIIDTADDVEAPGFDPQTGHGRINAYEAVALAASADGTLRLEATAYACDSVIAVTVSDIDLAGAGTLSIPVTSDSESGGENALLTEVGNGSGVFRGSIPTEFAPPTADGVLQVAHGDTVVATYVDADDGAGGSAVVKTATAIVDCVAPVISGVGTQAISNDAVTVVWSTDEEADSTVRYAVIPPPAFIETDSALVTGHTVTLNGLAECTTYLFEVESADSVDNTTIDDNGSAFWPFTTWGNFPGLGLLPCNLGRTGFDRSGTYGCSDTAGIWVTDTDLDTDPGVVETVDVRVTSTTEPQGEVVTLTELTGQSSRFEGSVPVTSVPAVGGDGLLSVSPGDLLIATYLDADDGFGGSKIATDTSSTDCTPPLISGIQVTESSSTRAVVEWTTDKPATSRVEFGATTALGSVVESLTPTMAHSMVVSPFDACDRIWFRVMGTDQHGDTGIADAAGLPFEVSLRQIGGLVYHETFETDSGWQLPGDWERDTPQGLGSPAGDPTEAYSGAYAIGNDLSGQGSYPGDYEPSTSLSAISPSINTRQERNLELIVKRKLGVTSADEAGIYVTTSGTDQVWTSNYGIDDSDWSQRSYDISAFADNQNSVFLEFRIESDDPDTSYGWNLDEVIIKDATQPDYLVCGGCAGAPTFRGVTAAYDPDPCGPGGVVVEWEAAGSWGTGINGNYDVYRGATSDFVPDAGNRVATGISGSSWTDAGAPVDTPVWYVVRARNNESCGGEGLADSNLVRLPATETTSQSLPQPVGHTLISARLGGTFVRLEWAPVAGAELYRVRRGQAPDFADAVEIGATAETIFEDAEETTAGTLYLYEVRAVDSCGREE